MELPRQSASDVLAEGVRLTLDLRNIYFIDCEGVELIKSPTDRGVRQVNAPPFVTEQILEVRGWTGRLSSKEAKLMRRRLLIKRRLQQGRLRARRGARAKEGYGKASTEF